MTPPSSNASKQSGQPAPSANGVRPQEPQLFASEARTVVDLRPGFCTCGCDNRVRTLFVPGHNGRLKGALVRSYRLAQRVVILQALGEPQLVSAPEAADLLGPEWLALVAPDAEVQAEVRTKSRRSLAAAADVFEAEWEGL